MHFQNSIASVSRKELEWSRERARAIGAIHAYADWIDILHAVPVQELNSATTPILATEGSSGVDQVIIAPSTHVKHLTLVHSNSSQKARVDQVYSPTVSFSIVSCWQ